MENMTWIWWALGAAFFFYLMRPSVPADAKLTPADVKEMVGSDKALQLVDVRSIDEFGGGHLSGARNIPVDQMDSRLAELSKEKALVVYCQSGMRSARAIKILRGAGFAKAKHMVGGIAAWRGAGLPVAR